MADLGAIESDVEFDLGVADTLITACGNAATVIEGQAGSRATSQSTALTDFEGHFSELFRANAGVAASDATELCTRLREVATGARRLKEEAVKEQQRRETARAWKKEHDERSNLEKAGDWLSGGDDPPVGPPAEEPSIPVSAPATRARQTPAPGGGSGSGGGATSSARPASLRTFATQSSGANSALASRPAALKADYTTFQARCKWGTLEASGVFVGFDKWLAANVEDARWATVVANAFTAAGGEGAMSTLPDSAVAAALRAAHVSVSRQDLVIEPPQAQGFPPTTGYANDPVNTSTGNFIESETDLGFAGAASSLALTRCYNSFAAPSGPSVGAFGPGWSSLAEAGLAFDTEAGTARFTLPDGRLVMFPRLGEGWDRATGENLWLASDSDDSGSGGLRVSGNDGSWWSFATDGTPLAYGTGPADAHTSVRLVRDPAGRLTGLAHARGRTIDLTWDLVSGADRVVAATTSDGRRADYTYDGAGRLTAATGPLGTRSYRWTETTESGEAVDAVIAAVTDADGVVEAENVYDGQRRVVAQRSPYGRTTRFAYLPGRVTVVSDEDGSRANTWIADDRGRLVGVIDAADQRQSTSYDRWGNPVMFTARDGATTVHAYDDRGRRVRTVTPAGADLTYSYDDQDRVTTVVTEQGAITEYTYPGDDRNPDTIADPEGGISELVWAAGLLQQVTDPTGVVVRFGYDEHGDLAAVVDADGNTARMEHDDLGRTVAALTPAGHRTSYAYDPVTGLLASRRDPDGATWSYEHTAAGRLTTVIDPTGARTSVEHGAHGDEARTIDPLGRAVSRRLDDLGNLSAVELPDGSSWRFSHDALSRLTTTVDPTGGTWRNEFDTAGHLTATVDPTGVRSGVSLDQAAGLVSTDDGDATSTTGFDPLGRITSLGQADGSAAVLTYDRCGRPVESLDAEGGLTVIRRDVAGRPVQVTSPSGAVTRYAYDHCGRLISVIDPVGAQTTIAHTADGYPERQTLPTGEVALTRYDACGRVVEHHRPGGGTLTYTYDPAGRVVATRDPRTGRRQFGYDPAGQLVAVTDGNGGVTRYSYDANGRAVAITNPVGGVTRREFDGMNHCVAETDPLGRTTRAGYDAAGRLAWQEDPDGHRTTWTYDAAGRPSGLAVDGRTVSALTRDLRRRTVSIDDRTGTEPVAHELEWNRRGQLVRRARDGREVSWTYDADGRRTAMTTPDGQTTRYGCDPAGRLTWVEHPLLGRAVFDHDPSGRVTSATAGGVIQAWEHHDGLVVAHTITDGEGASRTTIDRDADGRISQVNRDTGGGAETVTYTYDQACQLIEARIRRSTAGSVTGDSVTGWRYDPAGRLAGESVDGATVEHVYDLAGQLLTSVHHDGQRVSYSYDGSGRRTRATDDRGLNREYAWSPTGHLAAVTDHSGDQVRRTTLCTDATGELASVDDVEFFWDTAAYAGVPVLAGDTAVVAAGPVTGIGADWSAPGWRTARATGTDPWSAADSPLTHGHPGGVGIGASGEVTVAGLEWMGARVYDPSSRGFLSVDPLDPTTGAGWAANPYAYAGNDPLHALDPQGLHPVTDAELQAYRDDNGIGGTVKAVGSAVGGWVKNNWEYVAGGAMVIAGGALIATGVGGPAGVMLMSAGADTIIQKATTGEVNWGQVAVSGAAGAVGFGVGGAVAKSAIGSGLRGTIAAGAAGGAAEGAAYGGGSYLTGPGPHTAGGLVDHTVVGAATGMALGGAGGAAAHGVSSYAGRTLDDVVPTPSHPTPLNGVDTVAKGERGVQASIAAAEARGERVLGSEVTVDTAVGRVRPDLLVEEPSGARKFIDAKNGPHAKLTPNQTVGYPELRANGGIPRGKNAEAAGLTPGVPIGPTPVQIDHWPSV